MNVGELLPQVVKNRKLRYHQKSGVLHFLPEDDKQELVFLSSIVVQLWEPYTTIARPWWGLILRISLVDVRGPPEEFYVELTECLGNVLGTVHSHWEIGLWKWHPRWLITNSLHMPRSSMRLQTRRLKDSKTRNLQIFRFVPCIMNFLWFIFIETYGVLRIQTEGAEGKKNPALIGASCCTSVAWPSCQPIFVTNLWNAA